MSNANASSRAKWEWEHILFIHEKLIQAKPKSWVSMDWSGIQESFTDKFEQMSNETKANIRSAYHTYAKTNYPGHRNLLVAEKIEVMRLIKIFNEQYPANCSKVFGHVENQFGEGKLKLEDLHEALDNYSTATAEELEKKIMELGV